MVKTSVIFCLLCSGWCNAEGTASNKLRSPTWRVRVNCDPYFATSLACIHTGICSIMNPNMTAWNGKITTLIAPCGIRSAMTRVHWPHDTIQLSFIWKRNAKEQPNEPFQMGHGWSQLVFLPEEKRSDEMRGERVAEKEGEEMDRQNERGHWAQREDGAPLSWRVSGEDEATYLMVTSGKWGPITTQNANAKLWAPGTGPVP